MRKWNADDGELSIDKLRMMFPSERFRVSRYAYPSGALSGGVLRQCLMFVIKGNFWIKFSEKAFYSAGDVVEIESGEYEIGVSEESEAELVFVWDLSEIAKIDQG